MKRINLDKPWIKCPFCKHQVYHTAYSDELTYCPRCKVISSPLNEVCKTGEEFGDALWIGKINPSKRDRRLRKKLNP